MLLNNVHSDVHTIGRVPREVFEEVNDQALVHERQRQDPTTDGTRVGHRTPHTEAHSTSIDRRGHEQPLISWPG